MFAGACERGHHPDQPGKPNQDAIVMQEAPDGREDALLLCVFDGHGDAGHIVSAHLRQRVPELVFAASDDRLAQAPGTVLQEAIKTAEAELVADTTVATGLSGSTAVVCLVQGDRVTTANVGDSRAMLVQTDGKSLAPLDLTTDHKPTVRSETKRILLQGGELRAIRYPEGDEGPVRVWCSGEDVPGLAMSRSVCDTVGKRAGIISDADVTTTTLTTRDAFLVVASDGLFEFMTGEDVCTGVLIAHRQALEAGAPEEHLTVAVNELRREATQRWIEEEAGNVDDCSIIIAEIGHVVAAP